MLVEFSLLYDVQYAQSQLINFCHDYKNSYLYNTIGKIMLSQYEQMTLFNMYKLIID